MDPHTLFSLQRGKCVRVQIAGETFASLTCTPYTVFLRLLGFWGHSFLTLERNNPEHIKHSGLAMNYLTEIVVFLLSS